jgi:catechol 2,3-dioxygenase-like lactoylglutathione lyase family enzyme
VQRPLPLRRVVPDLLQGEEPRPASVPPRIPRSRDLGTYARAMNLELVAIVVDEYQPAIDFFVKGLGFELAEDSPSLTNDGRPKRWVVVRPPGAQTGLLLARADGDTQAAVVGSQVAGRVGFFLRVDDFDAAYARMTAAGVEFVTAPRAEPYGRVAVFLDIAGNRWDLLGPA